MESQDSIGAIIRESLEHGRDLLQREIHQVREELREVLGDMMRGGLTIAAGGALAAAGLSTVWLVALVEPSPRRARLAYALGSGALAVAAGLIGWGLKQIPEAPVREVELRVAEDLSRSLPH